MTIKRKKRYYFVSYSYTRQDGGEGIGLEGVAIIGPNPWSYDTAREIITHIKEHNNFDQACIMNILERHHD